MDDDSDEFGDTQPFESISGIEPTAAPPSPGYHIATPPISRSAPSGQVSRMFPYTDPQMGGEGTKMGGPAPNAKSSGDPGIDSKLGTPVPAIPDSTWPPMGGKLGGKLGNDVMPGKTSAESPPGGTDVPVASPPDTGGYSPIPQEALDLLESMGLEGLFDEGSPSTEGTTTTTSQTTTGGGGSSTQSSGGDEGGEGGDQPSNAEDAAQSGGVNVDKLARDVFSVLRDRLRIEQERRSTR
jgi:hypothetical protein